MGIYWNDKELIIEPYNKQTKHYYCGKELLKFDHCKSKLYTILLLDLEDCYCADIYSDGEISKVFDLHSEVPHQHRSGGQSAQRFERIRENEIINWFKRINEYLNKSDIEILYLGVSFVYKKRFLSYLSKEISDKINKIEKTEYISLSGIHQYLKKIEQ